MARCKIFWVNLLSNGAPLARFARVELRYYKYHAVIIYLLVYLCTSFSPHVRDFGFQNQRIFALEPGNTAQGIRNPTNDWNPSSTDKES